MASLNEVLAEMGYLEDSVQFTIDEDMRTIAVPADGVIAGVVGDKNINRINFQMPRMYNGFDMSTFETRINYVNAQGRGNYYTVTDVTVSDDKILFTWLIDSDVTASKGTVDFVVKMLKTSNGVVTQSFSTAVANIRVIEGLEVTDQITPEEVTDILNKLKADVDAYLEESVPEDYSGLVDEVGNVRNDLAEITKCRSGRFSPDGQYIALHRGNTDYSVKYQDGFNYAVMDVVSGEKVHLYTVGGNEARAYGFVNSEGTIIEVADVNVTIDEILTVPDGAVKIVVNTKDIATAEVYVGRMLSEEIDELDNRLIATNGKIQDVNTRIDNVSNRGIIEDVPCFNGYVQGATLYMSDSFSASKTIYIPVSKGNKYTIQVTGNFNRFNVCGTNELAHLAPVTVLLNSGATDFTDKSYTYEADGTYAYIVVVIAYEYEALSYTATVSKNITEPWKINGVELYSKDETDAKIIKSNRTIMDVDLYCNGYYQKIDDNNGKIVPTSGSKIIYFPVIAGNQYDLTVEGDFNRFIVFGTNEPVTGGTLCTKLYSKGAGSFAKESYTYEADGTCAYIGVNIAYNYSALTYSATVQVGGIGQPWKINRVELYSKDETDALMSSYGGNTYEQYISDTSVSVLPTTTSLYALYDELVTNHSDYVTKNMLGTDDFGNSVYEYVFTSGNYNSQEVRRNKDAEIEKPVILLVTGIHGYERTSIMSTYQFLRDLCNYSPKLMAIRENLTFKVIPCANPWSFDNNTRWNGNGVNINRNFDRYWTLSTAEAFTNDYSGASPADQKETQIVQSWIESNTNAVLYIDYHNSGYEDEVAYLGGVVGTKVTGMEELKKVFLKKSYEHRAYLIDKENYADDLIFGYVGNFIQNSMSYYYAENKGLLSCCLECSWNQNYTGRHSNQSIKTGAEELGNFLIGFYYEFI